ncbi:hypothetical protein [Streptomyces sp. NPDC101132]|uniref:hypothetical protein n=1 Tax=Streptomyces sp. NPDC101132 TaxID=3366110 RepID=UPI0037F4796D
MRRRIVTAVVTGAAGLTLGLMPMAGASATGGGTWRCDDRPLTERQWQECCKRVWNNTDDWWWQQCCNRDWDHRPSWCWDDVDAVRHDHRWNDDHRNDVNDHRDHRNDNGNWNDHRNGNDGRHDDRNRPGDDDGRGDQDSLVPGTTDTVPADQ